MQQPTRAYLHRLALVQRKRRDLLSLLSARAWAQSSARLVIRHLALRPTVADCRFQLRLLLRRHDVPREHFRASCGRMRKPRVTQFALSVFHCRLLPLPFVAFSISCKIKIAKLAVTLSRVLTRPISLAVVRGYAPCWWLSNAVVGPQSRQSKQIYIHECATRSFDLT